MGNEGDVKSARENFLKDRFPNLDFLLRSRYEWMNSYIKEGDTVLEIGSGAGFSPLYLKVKPILTDAIKNDWIDKIVDATNMDLANGSVDVLIASHTIHHFYNPAKFFFEALRVLKPGGVLLIQDIWTSWFMRTILKMMRHEGWSYGVNVFSTTEIANDPSDLWSANCAIPQLLFSDTEKFENYFMNSNGKFEVVSKRNCECLTFLLSGGVIAKTPVPKMPVFLLKLAGVFDTIVSKICPSGFALGVSVVLKKVKSIEQAMGDE